MNIVGCQLDSVWENKVASFARAQVLFDAKPPLPGSLVVLPEMFATGFSANTAATQQGPTAECEQFLAGLARKYGVTVLGGVVGSSPGGGCSNDAVAFSESGALICRYSKIQPFTGGGEHQVHTAGREVRTFSWGGFVVAPLICYDLRFPELFRAGVRRGATLFVVMASWPVMRDRHWQILLQARAVENQAYVLGVNRCGRDPQFYHSGRSALIDPLGVAVADAGEGERLLQADADPVAVANWRRDFPAIRDMGWTDSPASGR